MENLDIINMNSMFYTAKISNSKGDIMVTLGMHILHYSKSLWSVVKMVPNGKHKGPVIGFSR